MSIPEFFFHPVFPAYFDLQLLKLNINQSVWNFNSFRWSFPPNKIFNKRERQTDREKLHFLY
uniref:Uncharacterized protein n=1 Tax=Octopus bimaculoides TaxID=37653 RepID=A0A0L8HYA6_OCTBM